MSIRALVVAAGLAVGFAISPTPTASAQTLRWTRTPGPATGASMQSLDLLPSRGLACDRTRIFRLTADAWADATSGLPTAPGITFQQVLLHQSGEQIREFVRRGDGAVFRHEPSGWQPLATSLPAATQLAASETTLFLLANPFSGEPVFLFRSSDAGDTWTPLALPEGEFPSSIHTVGGALIATRAFGTGFLISLDLGETWQESSTDGPAFLLASPAVVDRAWVVPSDGVTFSSTDFGQTWSAAPSSGFFAGGGFSHLIFGDGTLIATNAQSEPPVLRSDDAGRTWAPAALGLPRCIEGFIQDLDFRDGQFVISTSSGLFRSDDAGLSWSPLPGGPELGVAAKLAATDRLHAVGRGNARVFSLTETGWSNSAAGIPACIQPDGFFAEGSTLFVGSLYDGIVRSTDGGQTFAPLNTGLPIYNGTAGNQLREVSAFARHAGRLLAGTGFGIEFFEQAFQISGGGMLRLNDAGTGWTRINRGYPIMARNLFNEPVYDPVVSIAEASGPWGQLVLVGSYRNGPIRSSDRGDNWSRSNAGLPLDPSGFPPMINDFAVLGDRILAGAIGFPIFLDPNGVDRGVFLSRDAGRTWTRASTNVADLAPVNAFAVLSGIAYAGADRVYRSTDGDRWEPVPGTPEGEVLDLIVLDGRLHAAVREPAGSFVWTAEPSCLADFNADGFVDFFDYADFVACFQAEGCPEGRTADANQDGFIDFFDYADFVDAFESGC
jgi:photosystem II stability/assembly factor-like uncharacterized protein